MELVKFVFIALQLLSFINSSPTRQYFVSEPSDVTSMVGDSLKLDCVVKNKKGECQWTKDGFGLGIDPDLPGFQRFSMSDCSLNIFPVLVEDEGDYQCQVGAAPGALPIVSDSARLTVIAPPGMPYIKQAKESDVVEVTQGEEIELECESHGAKPAAELQWKDQDGNIIISNLMETVIPDEKTKTFKTVSSLRLKPNSGIRSVTCSAFNEAFKEPRISRQLKIRLKYKPKLQLIGGEETAKEGDNLVLQCEAEAYPAKVTYRWFINEKEMEEESNMLKLNKVTKILNNAEVKCVAHNEVGTTSVRKNLRIEFVPRILEQPETIIAKHGDEVTFSCLAEGNPQPNYIWVKGKEENIVGVSPKLKLLAEDDTEDEYLCKVFVEGHKVLYSRKAELIIMRKPTVNLDEERLAKLGEDVILNCEVDSFSKNTKLTWTKNKIPVEKNMVKHRVIQNKEKHEFTSSLIIYNIENSDFAEYGCFAANEIGTDFKVITLVKEEESNTITVILSTNTLVGAFILLAVVIYHKKRKKDKEKPILPTVQKEVLQPIFKGKDQSVLEELLLNKGMHEEYLHMTKEYFDNVTNTEKDKEELG